MHMFTCIFLAAIFCQDSGTSKQTPDAEPPVKNEVSEFLSPAPTESSVVFKKEINSTKMSKSTRNLSLDSNLTTLGVHSQFKSEMDRKGGIENKTLNDIKPFLLFPILPFLFPKETDESLVGPAENELVKNRNDSAVENDALKGKPFIFFDFAFNIRQIPLKNRTEPPNDSKIKSVKSLSFNGSPFVHPKKNAQKIRRKKSSGIARERPGIFDDFSLFPESETEEFFPKSELFFPDFSFLPNSRKKLSRRKRGMKKSDVKSDFKFFMDAFDEAFMSTKRELERTDPILNFLEGGEHPFDEYKKGAEDLTELQEKPNLEWRIQRNAGKLNDDRRDLSRKPQETPMIIVDKVVKIGEFHIHDDNHDKSKAKRKKKAANDVLRKLLGGDDHGKRRVEIPQDKKETKNTLEWITQQGKKNKIRKRVSELNDERKTFVKAESKEIRVLPRLKTSFYVVGGNASILLKKKEPHAGNSSEKTHILKVIDSVESEIRPEQQNGAVRPEGRLKRRSSEKLELKKPPYDDLKKNITAVLAQFLALAEDTKSVNGLGAEEREDEDFDWSERETLENGDGVAKEPQGKRVRKATEYEENYLDADMEKKERQVADLNYLFVSVTLPTVFMFALLLFVCFFFLRVKGKICTKLFEPRKVFLVEEETVSKVSSRA